MGEINIFRKQKLIAGILSSLPGRKDEILKVLSEEFGPVDYLSREILFTYTCYYNREMGDSITRFFVSFRDLVNPENLSDFKVRTNCLEKMFSLQTSDEKYNRKVNIDPGILSQSRLVLASTKDFSHRVPIKNGIYGEVTLIYRGGRFEPLPWTFPDYRSDEYLEILSEIREIYRNQLKH